MDRGSDMGGLRKGSRLLLLAVAGLLAACSIERDPEPGCNDAGCLYNKALESGHGMLDDFQGRRAVELYTQAIDLALNPNNADFELDLCQPTYGRMLGSTQQFISVFNLLIENVVNLVGLAAAPGLQPMTTRYAVDLGEFITNYYIANFRGPLERIATDAAALLEDPRLNGERGVACVFEFGAGVPFRLGNNDPLPKLRRDKPGAVAVELRIGERWDAAEARLLRFLADGVSGFLFYWMAHSIELNSDQIAQLIGRVTKDVLDPVLACFDATSPQYGNLIDEADERAAGTENPDGVVNTVNECLYLTPTLEYEFTEILRSFGWLAGDNPRTLARASDRWDVYMPEAPRRAASAWGALEFWFDSLVERVARHGNEPRASLLMESYAIFYDDREFDGIVNRGDSIGLNVVGLGLKLPESFGDTEQISDSIRLLLTGFLRFEISQTELVDLLETLFRKVAVQHRAAYDPEAETEQLRLTELTPLVATTGFFGADAIPDGIAVNFTAFYTDPVPFRDFFPYWEATGSTTWSQSIVNEFIIEEEMPGGVVRGSSGKRFNWMITRPTGMPDVAHFATTYTALDPEEDAFNPTVPVPSDGIPLPADCLIAEDQGEDFIASLIDSTGLLYAPRGMLYFYMQDPSFNGFLEVNSDLLIGTLDRAPGCALPGAPWQTSSYQPANLWSFHVAGVAIWRWFISNFDFADLLASFL